MPTSIWTGSLSFGLVVVPVRLYPAVRKKVVRFHELAPAKSRVIDVEQFVDIAAIDPIYFESRYHVAPDRISVAPFRLLARAMADAERMAIGWITLRQRRYLSAIRPYGEAMLLTTM